MIIAISFVDASFNSYSGYQSQFEYRITNIKSSMVRPRNRYNFLWSNELIGAFKSTVKHAVIRYLIRRENTARDCGTSGLHGLEPELWGCSVDESGALLIDGVSAVELRESYGTPLHVLNESQLLTTKVSFLKSFENVYPNVVLATSYKTNPVPYVLDTLHKAGTHAEVISLFELWLAIKLGVPPEKIIVNGPGKGLDALRLSVEHRVQMINIDGPEEISQIAGFAKRDGVSQRVGVRVISSVGWSSQFGLSIRSGMAKEAFKKILGYPELEPAGLHLHLGTGIQSVATYVQAVREIVKFGQELKRDLGITIDHYDLGGGFGVPTVRGLTEWDARMISLGYPARSANPALMPRPEDYATALSPILGELHEETCDNGAPPVVVFEPGRAITSSGQVLLLSVIGRKPANSGNEILILDGGKNITMPLGWETHQIYAAEKMTSVASMKADLFGPLCHPGDIVVKNKQFPALATGDVIAIMDAGAYFIPNQMNFSNPRPPIVQVKSGRHKVVRRRERFEDIICADVTLA